MKILELFCGTKSMSKVFERAGHECFTLDYERKFNPDICIDILKFDISMLPEKFRTPDVIWASPPCTAFSVAAIGKNWTEVKGVGLVAKSARAIEGMAILEKTIAIIQELSPKLFFLENPRGAMRKMPIMTTAFAPVRHTLTYCQYGERRQKPTDIWTNSGTWKPRPMCQPGASCHDAAPRG